MLGVDSLLYSKPIVDSTDGTDINRINIRQLTNYKDNHMADVFKLTKDGKAELKAELEKRLSERPAIAGRIATAREFGDLRENAEYSSAKEEQAKNESRISEIDHILKHSELIQAPAKADKVIVGSTVELEGNKGVKKFTVVGSVEANPSEGKISDESPIGQATLGKKLGDTVELKMPGGNNVFIIKSIS